MSESSQVKTVIDQLLTDEYEDLRKSVMAAYLEDDKRGADLIIAFGAKQGITLNQDEVIAFIDEMDEDEFDIELTPEMLTSIAGGGGKDCHCQEEAHDEPWGRCPGMRPMRKWLFGANPVPSRS
ncbi:hypothetical protein SynPROS71_01262 [Synechococcus sp. PROS-7-1]|uniref:hypothetical protein n=1 Tax=Synechococcus sp. PROS-7-1 TaxID=1442556 RepID=UPI0016458133|nr:hypothetical protein [Synechococcus sp. PROS-7-1]QNI85065.1 hypothetical protein SynPROS71_01262 [Synechococcus sp. PROS-7-1]